MVLSVALRAARGLSTHSCKSQLCSCSWALQQHRGCVCAAGAGCSPCSCKSQLWSRALLAQVNPTLIPVNPGSVPGILSDPELVQQFCPWDVQGRKGGGERSRVNTSGYKMKPERHRSGASVPDCYWDSCKARPWHSAVRAAALPNKPSLFHWCCCISQPFPPSSELNQTGLLSLSVQASLELIMDYGKAGLRVSPLECPGM